MKRIPLGGMVIHNPFVTPDGKYLIAASNDAKTMMAAVIDQKTEEQVRTIYYDGRPENPDRRPAASAGVQHESGRLHEVGLCGADRIGLRLRGHGFRDRQGASQDNFPHLGGAVKMQVVNPSVNNPNHGIGAADNKAVWISEAVQRDARVLPAGSEIRGAAPVGVDPFWVTFTPDSNGRLTFRTMRRRSSQLSTPRR